MTNTLKIVALLIPLLLTSCDGSALAAFAKDELYRSGQKAIDEGRWTDAEKIFGQVAERGDAEADAGLYWKAYAQHKAGRDSEALATIRQLASGHPKSSWLDDARALEVEVRGDRGVLVQPSAGDDEDLKLYALSGMMDNKPEKALPLVLQYLRGQHSLENKEKALFLLTQSDLPQARQALLEIVRGSAHPDLRLQAVEYLGNVAEDDPSVLPVLDELYRSSQDRRMREAVLDAYASAEHWPGLLAVARSEKDPKLRRQALERMDGDDAAAELRSLLQGETDPEIRRAILRSLGDAGDVDSLIAAARGDKDLETRVAAIHSLGDVESPRAAEALRSLYTGAADRRIRSAVINAFENQENAKALIELFRAEKDPGLRKEIIRRLTDMETPEAEAFVDKIFEQN